MRVYSRTLDIKQFEKDFSSLIGSRKDKEAVLNDVITRINAANADIATFLKNVDEIEDKSVQGYCRCAAIAQMYHINPECQGRYPHFLRPTTESILQIYFKHNLGESPAYSSAFVSKYGEVIIHEGVLERAYHVENYSGWIVTSAMSGKDGFISNYGELVIPCRFDNTYEEGKPYFIYKGISFELTVYGKLDTLPDFFRGELLDLSVRGRWGRDFIICCSKDGFLYVLSARRHQKKDNRMFLGKVATLYVGDIYKGKEVDPEEYQEALNDVQSFMSPCIISKEELQRLLES